MNVIIPEEYKNISIDELLIDNKILFSKDNKPYINTIFPEKTKISRIDNFNKSKLITQIDDSLFSDFYILDKKEQIIYIKDNSIRKYIKCKEYGDYNNSYKRYNGVNAPFDYNQDSFKFLNIKSTDQVENNNKTLRYFIPEQLETISLDNSSNNLPTINKTENSHARFNDITTIKYVLEWAKTLGITYIYAIVENRPYIINKTYTTPYVYYTVLGSTGEYIKDTIIEEPKKPSHTIINNFSQFSLPTPIVPPTPGLSSNINLNDTFIGDLTSGDTLDIYIKDEDDNTVTPNDITYNNGKLDIEIPNCDNTTVIYAIFDIGVSNMPSITITEENSGNYTSITQDGNSGTISYTVNGITPNNGILNIGDVFSLSRTNTISKGWVKISGIEL